jgi:hypothetical protein
MASAWTQALFLMPIFPLFFIFGSGPASEVGAEVEFHAKI